MSHGLGRKYSSTGDRCSRALAVINAPIVSRIVLGVLSAAVLLSPRLASSEDDYQDMRERREREIARERPCKRKGSVQSIRGESNGGSDCIKN